MNILCINHEFPPIGGGGATACKNITEYYAKMGHTVTVLTAAFENLPKEETLNNVHVIRVSCKRISADHSSFSEMLSFLVAAFFRLKKLVQQQQFDVTHIFFGIPSGPLGWFLKKRYGISYLVRLGGGDIPGAQKRFDVIYKLTAPFLKIVWKDASYVVANSKGLLVRAQNFYNKANFNVITNGINPEHFTNLTVNKNDDTVHICSTARIIPRKGLQHVIEALPALAKATGGKIAYTIIGDGPYREELENLAQKLQVEQYLTITGFIDRTEVLSLLSQFDIFVCPSYSEGMPNVVLEAMACGLPIVMTDCEGSEELVQDNGIIVPLKEDITGGIENALLQLVENEPLRVQMAQRSKTIATAAFTWENTAKQYLALLQSINTEPR